MDNQDNIVPPRPHMPASEAAARRTPDAAGVAGRSTPEPPPAAPAQNPQLPGAWQQPQDPYAQGDSTTTQPTEPFPQSAQQFSHGMSSTEPFPQDVQANAFGPAAAPSPADDRSPRKKKTGARVAGLLVAAALVGGAAGLGGTYAGMSLWGPNSSTAGASSPETVTVNNPGSVNEATGVATEVLPSTVTISATGGQASGSGTGVVLSKDGYVVTNTHVVTLGGEAADATIRVTDSSGRIYDAEVVGTDPIYDLAVIKLEGASDLAPIEFADSSDLNVGDTTVAVGAPLGLPNTVTTGIVSALNRSIDIQSAAAPEGGDRAEDEPEQESPWFFDIPGQEERPDANSQSISIAVVQTDAAINPGNSGGALVDSQGRLIGVNVAIATAGGESSSESGSVGIGFAIPSNIVQRVTDEIIAGGSATHGLLGASVTSSAMHEDATIEGAYIEEITPDGAAAEAGLKPGDIVTAFNGVPITSSNDLTAQVRAAAAGSEASLSYVRDGEAHSMDVTLGALE